MTTELGCDNSWVLIENQPTQMVDPPVPQPYQDEDKTTEEENTKDQNREAEDTDPRDRCGFSCGRRRNNRWGRPMNDDDDYESEDDGSLAAMDKATADYEDSAW